MRGGLMTNHNSPVYHGPGVEVYSELSAVRHLARLTPQHSPGQWEGSIGCIDQSERCIHTNDQSGAWPLCSMCCWPTSCWAREPPWPPSPAAAPSWPASTWGWTRWHSLQIRKCLLIFIDLFPFLRKTRPAVSPCQAQCMEFSLLSSFHFSPFLQKRCEFYDGFFSYYTFSYL